MDMYSYGAEAPGMNQARRSQFETCTMVLDLPPYLRTPPHT